MSWDWNILIQVATSAIGAGVVAACVNQGLVWLKEHRRARQDASREQRHTALIIAIALESFALACANWIGDAECAEAEADARHSHEPLAGLGPIPLLSLPEDVNWRWMAPSLAAHAHELPLLVEYSRSYANATTMYGDPFDWAAEARKQIGRRGNEAWLLAEALRAASGLPASRLDTDPWDFRETFAVAAKSNDAPFAASPAELASAEVQPAS
ncbi:hypothetical protein [Cupriavidus alkaliphilus]|uniref:Uncharacterized protein n=1 Tax=Cupriavidus alkaliphilus TaxID=942866 RepID=A0A7W4VE93_9BURK|nr:hypothetical protein [Cupriavidus alkaliphilus]MBB3009986.1 hypothetical protein [Cupriavidus alkaliphilus]